MNIISLFDGCGMFFEELKKRNIPYTGYSSEIDKFASAVSKYNHPHIKQVGDVYNFVAKDIENVDIVVAGFPCQPFSIAGNRKGLSDDRGTLYTECKRIVQECKPKYFIFENVPGMKREDIAKISEYFYGINPTLINASTTTAQNRKRNWWVAKRNDKGGYDKVYLYLPTDDLLLSNQDEGLLLKDILIDFDLELKDYILNNTNKKYKEKTTYQSSKRLFDLNKKSHVVLSTDYKDIFKLNIENYIFTNKDKKCKDSSKLEYEHRYHNINEKAPTQLARADKIQQNIYGYTFKTIKQWFIDNDKWFEEEGDRLKFIRKLTELEVERLMNLKDFYSQYGDFNGEIKPISRTQRYKMLGNGFIPDIVIDNIINNQQN